jgi:hypothetical protein
MITAEQVTPEMDSLCAEKEFMNGILVKVTGHKLGSS